MKKKNLIILLMVPFIIAIIGLMTINVTFTAFKGDITSIEWKYDDVETFSVNISKHKLTATAMNANNAPLAEGNTLVWTVENKDPSILDPIAEIVVDGGVAYLVPKTTGEVIITCSNFNGNIFKKMEAIIYDDGVITVQPVIAGSQNNIDPNIYYGEYDLDGKNKKNASFKLKYECIPADLSSSLKITATDNIRVEKTDKEITVTVMSMVNDTDASVKLESGGIKAEYNFKIVKDGVNVYTYNDLLNCTNKSENGEIVVLRKSFESNVNHNPTKNNEEVFGGKSDNYNFTNDVYRFETTFNNEYIKQWNEFAKNNSDYSSLSTTVIAGLRVQKDFYGNGYTINMHDLTYPSLITEIDGYQIPTLAKGDLFRGPLEFYTLGDPNNIPLVTAYGQDNIGMYVDGNNILVNDINLKNCDMGASLQFLETVGTVLEVNGDNNTIKNSRLTNGKNVLRSFSSNNLLIDNSLLSNSMNFLITTGSNEYVKLNEKQIHEFTDSNGSPVKATLLEYLAKNAAGDVALTSFLMGNYSDVDMMKKALDDIQNATNDKSLIEGEYKGSMTINDTYFYHSGLASICLETLFNGPFLAGKSPSMIGDIFSKINLENRPVIPFVASNISGMSYPVTVDITGNTRFYDYKDANKIDLSGLIDENISSIASAVLGEDKQVTIDDVFPLRTLLLGSARQNGCITSNDGEYINIPIAYYGGSLNESKVTFEEMETDVPVASLEIDFVKNYLKLQSNVTDTSNIMSIMRDVMVKCVTVVTGFEPFEFVCVKGNYLYGETPNASDLIANAKE